MNIEISKTKENLAFFNARLLKSLVARPLRHPTASAG
jgi:hypothetical protein